jgi:hypothetical protein
MKLAFLCRWLSFDSVTWVVPLIVATGLAAAMAWISAFNVHPDEIHHARAADYYRAHWLPPKFGDPNAASSYSSYGYSYLHERDIVYLFAGKWAAIVAPFVGDIDLAYRFFNWALFAAIVVAFVRKKEARPLIVPLTLSAQVWYIFSYFNADAFALAVALFTAYQITARGSAFNDALDDHTTMRRLGGILLLGLGFGFLLLAKRNYYVFLLFLAAYVALREVGLRAALGLASGTLIGIGWYFRGLWDLPSWFYGVTGLAVGVLIFWDIWRRLPDPVFRRRMAAFAAAGALGLVFFFPRVVFDKLVVENPANEIATVEAAAEAFAADGFKPSQTASGVAQPALDLRGGGTSYAAMLFGQRQWLWNSFQSLVGVYDYFKIFHQKRFYVCVGIVYLVLLVSLGYGVCRSADTIGRESSAIASLYALLLVLVSSLHSWTSDFQPQGRYLFPAFVMLGVTIKDIRERVPIAAPVAAALAFVLATYSFFDTALGLIPKK